MLRSKEKVMPLISALLHFPFSLLHSFKKGFLISLHLLASSQTKQNCFLLQNQV